MVEEANTTASDQKKMRPDTVWRPGRLGAVVGQGPGDHTAQPRHDVAAQGQVEQGPLVGDRQAEECTGELGHDPHLHRLTEPTVATLHIVSLPMFGAEGDQQPARYVRPVSGPLWAAEGRLRVEKHPEPLRASRWLT